jgi:hypothetical protein
LVIGVGAGVSALLQAEMQTMDNEKNAKIRPHVPFIKPLPFFEESYLRLPIFKNIPVSD